ncbi:hypothetical protein [Lacticaseibacillus saniviri]
MMRVIDLLALLQDQPKNATIHCRDAAQQYNLTQFELRTEVEQEQLIFIGTTAMNPLHLWEFQLLLRQKDLWQRYVYIETPAGIQPIFGFTRKHQQLFLN